MTTGAWVTLVIGAALAGYQIGWVRGFAECRTMIWLTRHADSLRERAAAIRYLR